MYSCSVHVCVCRAVQLCVLSVCRVTMAVSTVSSSVLTAVGWHHRARTVLLRFTFTFVFCVVCCLVTGTQTVFLFTNAVLTLCILCMLPFVSCKLLFHCRHEEPILQSLLGAEEGFAEGFSVITVVNLNQFERNLEMLPVLYLQYGRRWILIIFEGTTF